MTDEIDYKAKYEELEKKLAETQKNLDDTAKFHNDIMQVFQDAATELGFVAKTRKIVPK